MTALDAPGVLDTVQRRLHALTPDTPRRWGRMSAPEMLCHLSDSFRGVMRERTVSTLAAPAVQRQLIRFIALHTPLPWPKGGVETRPEVDPQRLGTRPGDFDRDRDTLEGLMRRFVLPDTRCAPHPMFGALTRREWMLWGFRHVDHHFRQFGI